MIQQFFRDDYLALHLTLTARNNVQLLDNKYQIEQLLDAQRMAPTQLMKLAVVVFLTMAVSLLFASFFVSAATVPVVVQLMIAPLRPVRIKSVVAALASRL